MDNMNRDKEKGDYGKLNYGIGTVGVVAHKYPLWYYKTRNSILYVLGIIEVLLAFRFILKLLGANIASGFVSFIYTLSGVFIAPFTGIFRSYTSQGLVSRSIFEPSAIVALIVYAIVAWGIIKLVKIKALNEE
jgi:hypothetical protein